MRIQLTPEQKKRYEQLFEIAANGEISAFVNDECGADDIDERRIDAAAWAGLVEEWPELEAYDGATDEPPESYAQRTMIISADDPDFP